MLDYIIFGLVVFWIFFGLYKLSKFQPPEVTPEQRKAMYKKHCPRCGSENCNAYVETYQTSAGKTKTQYSANLNPFHPLTLVNKKEKVVRKPRYSSVSRMICNDCGKSF